MLTLTSVIWSLEYLTILSVTENLRQREASGVGQILFRRVQVHRHPREASDQEGGDAQSAGRRISVLRRGEWTHPTRSGIYMRWPQIRWPQIYREGQKKVTQLIRWHEISSRREFSELHYFTIAHYLYRSLWSRSLCGFGELERSRK